MLRCLVFVLAFMPFAATAEDAKPQPRSPILTADLCKPVCIKGRAALLSGDEKSLFTRCFVQSMCKADIISPPVAKTTDFPFGTFERLMKSFGAMGEVKG